jgi:hypothetical protein
MPERSQGFLGGSLTNNDPSGSIFSKAMVDLCLFNDGILGRANARLMDLATQQFAEVLKNESALQKF